MSINQSENSYGRSKRWLQRSWKPAISVLYSLWEVIHQFFFIFSGNPYQGQRYGNEQESNSIFEPYRALMTVFIRYLWTSRDGNAATDGQSSRVWHGP